MTKIQKISAYLLVIFNALLIIIPLASIMSQWLLINTNATYFSDISGISFSLEQTLKTPQGIINLKEIHWRPELQLLFFSADIIRLLSLLLSLIILKTIFKNYRKGEIFSVGNAICYRKLGILFLLDAFFFRPLSESLTILAATLHNPPEQRYFSISFHTDNLTPLFYGVLVIVISWVMAEASNLSEDHKFTI